jgi:hypothetical protein
MIEALIHLSLAEIIIQKIIRKLDGRIIRLTVDTAISFACPRGEIDGQPREDIL